MIAGRPSGILCALIACAGLTAADLASSGTAAYILAVAAIGAAGILASLCRDWRHDTAIRRLDRGPLPRRVPGASLRWERHVADALGVAREAVASDFAEWETEFSDKGAAA